MRIRLVGWAGDRPPVPDAEPVIPIDPNPDPPPPDDFSPPDPLVLTLEDGVPFHKADYQAMGYNRFDVICIGGAGGNASSFKETIPASVTYSHIYVAPGDDLYYTAYRYGFGGGGGGGGAHRIKGRLALLPSSCAVVVGAAGTDGGYFEQTSPYHNWRDGNFPPPPAHLLGTDGGASSFGGVICRASGGKAGHGYLSAFNHMSLGGDGGIGNSGTAGGGATSGQVGTFDGVIGKGGGGGSGAVINALGGFPGTTSGEVSSVGGRGNYQDPDIGISGSGGDMGSLSFDYERIDSEDDHNIVVAEHYDTTHAAAGAGGGAKTYPLNEDNRAYGSKADSEPGTGIVVIRLTYVLT